MLSEAKFRNPIREWLLAAFLDIADDPSSGSSLFSSGQRSDTLTSTHDAIGVVLTNGFDKFNELPKGQHHSLPADPSAYGKIPVQQ